MRAFVVLATLLAFISTAKAAHNPALGLKMRCVHSNVWAKAAQKTKAKPANPYIDGDGDAWVFWENEDSWWLTLVLENGAVTCPLARSKDLQPGKTHF